MGIQRNLEIELSLLRNSFLLAGLDYKQTKCHVGQTSHGAVSHYIQHFMTKIPRSTWEQLKSEIN